MKKRIGLITALVMFLSVFQFSAIDVKAANIEVATNYEDFTIKLVNQMVLFIGCEYTWVKGEEKRIDESNNNVVPFIKDGRTLVPVRFISESLNAVVDWNNETKTAAIKYNEKEVKLTIGSNIITTNGTQSYLDVPAQIIEGRTFIPLRALVEALGKKVFWDNRGLIVISDSDNLINLEAEGEYLNQFISKIQEAAKQIKINKIEMNEKIVEVAADTYYVENGMYPTQKNIEDRMSKSLDSLNLIIVDNGNGKYTLKSTYPGIDVEDYNFDVCD